MNSVIRSLSAVLIGVLLIVLKDSAMPFLVRLVGVAFFLPALISVINIYSTRKGAPLFPMVLMSIVDVGSMLFGLWLIIFPITFIELFVGMLAVALFCFSLFQIYVILSSYGRVGLQWGLLATPVLLAVLSVVLFANPFGTMKTVSVILGICAIVSGISDVLIYILANRNLPKHSETIE
ncbi:MAG: DUF308 domain-containing protein [Bacteroidaceae bacterium]|nr:DUF308 domain-containing protein [Bacteroidaceae bacterium]